MAYSAFKLNNNEAAATGYSHAAVFDYNGIADNATSSNQVTIATIPAGGGVDLVTVVEETALAGASDITLDVGTTSADPDEFIDALDVDAMTVPVSNTGDAMTQSAGTTTILKGSHPAGHVAAATSVLVEWNGTVASLTAGRVVILLRILDPLGATNTVLRV